LPPLEVQKVRPVDEIINYQGHRFQTRKVVVACFCP
jgi:hypothetical protein